MHKTIPPQQGVSCFDARSPPKKTIKSQTISSIVPASYKAVFCASRVGPLHKLWICPNGCGTLNALFSHMWDPRERRLPSEKAGCNLAFLMKAINWPLTSLCLVTAGVDPLLWQSSNTLQGIEGRCGVMIQASAMILDDGVALIFPHHLVETLGCITHILIRDSL